MGKRKVAFSKWCLGISILMMSYSSLAKTPIDKTLDFLVGPKLGSWRSFNCREAIDGKVTDEHAYYEFHDDGSYSRLNSYSDTRTRYLKSMDIKGRFSVKINDGMLKISFADEFVGSGHLDNHKSYDATLIGTDGNDTMALMMDRPVPDSPGVKDHLRLVCIGDRPSGGGPQRSY